MSNNNNHHQSNIYLSFPSHQLRNHVYTFLNKKNKRNQDQEKTNTNTITQIKEYNFDSVNEAKISNLLLPHQGSPSKFHLVQKYDLLASNKDFLIFQYPDNLKKYQSFAAVLTNPKKTSYVLDILMQILQFIKRLNSLGVVYYQTSLENILVSNETSLILLTHLEGSMRVAMMDNEGYASKWIARNIAAHNHHPLEVWVLHHLFSDPSLETMSYSMMESLCQDYFQLPFLQHLLRKEMIQEFEYMDQCKESLQCFINKPRNQIISLLLSFRETWDVFQTMSVFLENDLLTTEWFLSCIHPNPQHRTLLEDLSLENIMEHFQMK